MLRVGFRVCWVSVLQDVGCQCSSMLKHVGVLLPLPREPCPGLTMLSHQHISPPSLSQTSSSTAQTPTRAPSSHPTQAACVHNVRGSPPLSDSRTKSKACFPEPGVGGCRAPSPAWKGPPRPADKGPPWPPARRELTHRSCGGFWELRGSVLGGSALARESPHPSQAQSCQPWQQARPHTAARPHPGGPSLACSEGPHSSACAGPHPLLRPQSCSLGCQQPLAPFLTGLRDGLGSREGGRPGPRKL